MAITHFAVAILTLATIFASPLAEGADSAARSWPPVKLNRYVLARTGAALSNTTAVSIWNPFIAPRTVCLKL